MSKVLGVSHPGPSAPWRDHSVVLGDVWIALTVWIVMDVFVVDGNL